MSPEAGQNPGMASVAGTAYNTPRSTYRGERMSTTTPLPEPVPAAVPMYASTAEELHLLRQVAAGDPQAFDTLYQCYAPALRRFLRRRLPSPDLVDEACHDVLLVAWQQAARFQPKSRLSTWLHGIAKHRAQKAWQRMTR